MLGRDANPLRHQYLDALVSGRSAKLREGAIVAFLCQSFFDECGTGLDLPCFVLGGYLGKVEMWKQFSDDWQAVLDGKKDGLPPWPPFHAYLAENGKEGFGVLDAVQRKRRLGHLVSVIGKHRPQALIGYVDVQRFKEGLAEIGHERKRKETWSHPYEFVAATMVGAFVHLLRKPGAECASIEPIFDWMERFNIRTKQKIEKRVIRVIEVDHPELAGRIGVPRWPRPAERANYVPLQAADLLVWHVGRANNSPSDGPYRRTFRELKTACPILYAGPTGVADLQDDWVLRHFRFQL